MNRYAFFLLLYNLNKSEVDARGGGADNFRHHLKFGSFFHPSLIDTETRVAREIIQSINTTDTKTRVSREYVQSILPHRHEDTRVPGICPVNLTPQTRHTHVAGGEHCQIRHRHTLYECMGRHTTRF